MRVYTSKSAGCLACGKDLPTPRPIAMSFCSDCRADPARTVKAETGRYPRRSDTLRSGVKVVRLVQDFKRHGSIRRIATQYGLSRTYVTKLLRRKGCTTDQRVLKAAAKRDRIIQAFREGRSMNWITKHLHSAGDYVRAVLQEAGFDTPKVEHKIADWKKIIELYAEGHSTAVIGKMFKVGDETIRRGLIRRGIAMRSNTGHFKKWHAARKAQLASIATKEAELTELREKLKRLEARQPGGRKTDKRTSVKITLGACLSLRNISQSEMRKLLFPEQHDSDAAYANTRKLFSTHAEQIEAEKRRLSELSDNARLSEEKRARSSLLGVN